MIVMFYVANAIEFYITKNKCPLSVLEARKSTKLEEFGSIPIEGTKINFLRFLNDFRRRVEVGFG